MDARDYKETPADKRRRLEARYDERIEKAAAAASRARLAAMMGRWASADHWQTIDQRHRLAAATLRARIEQT